MGKRKVEDDQPMGKRKISDESPLSSKPESKKKLGGTNLKQTKLTSVILGGRKDGHHKIIKLTGKLEDVVSKNIKGADSEIKRNHQPGQLSDVRSFLAHAKTINPEKPLEAFSKLKGAKLCGFFERIAGSLIHANESEVRMHRRYATDLPEMMTCCVYNEGRYAIWRDDPAQNDVLIVHVPNEDHFPFIKVIGNRMEHVLFHLAGNNSDDLKNLLPKELSISQIYKDVQDIVKQRNRKKMGSLPNGVGIWVPEKNGVGYREIGESPTELKKMLTTIGTNNNYNVRNKAEEKLTELCAYITMANDECDFGMGLELGHFLWLANYQRLNKRAKQILVCAYNLLGREDYADVVKDHFDKREADAQSNMEENFKAAAEQLSKMRNA